MSKKLEISAYTTPTVGFPPKEGTWNFLQDAWREDLSDFIIGQIKSNFSNFTSSYVYVLFGCEISDLGASKQFSEGAVLYNGEVFHFPSKIVANPTGLNVFIVNINTSQFTVNADPVRFTDLINHDVHNIRTFDITTGASGSGVSNYSSFIFPFKPKLIEKSISIAGDFLDFTEKTNTVLYTGTPETGGAISVNLNFVNAVLGAELNVYFVSDGTVSSFGYIPASGTMKSLILNRDGTAFGAINFYIRFKYLGINSSNDFVISVDTNFI